MYRKNKVSELISLQQNHNRNAEAGVRPWKIIKKKRTSNDIGSVFQLMVTAKDRSGNMVTFMSAKFMMRTNGKK